MRELAEDKWKTNGMRTKEQQLIFAESEMKLSEVTNERIRRRNTIAVWGE